MKKTEIPFSSPFTAAGPRPIFTGFPLPDYLKVTGAPPKIKNISENKLFGPYPWLKKKKKTPVSVSQIDLNQIKNPNQP
jgi:hypothetical protein